jgi:hypothetical protein
MLVDLIHFLKNPEYGSINAIVKFSDAEFVLKPVLKSFLENWACSRTGLIVIINFNNRFIL